MDPVFDDVEITEDIAYGDLSAHKLDAYLPKGDAEVDRPVMLLIHGGGFAGGDKQLEMYRAMATEFARHGFVAFSINYRLGNPGSDPSVPDTAYADAAKALAWIRANKTQFGINPERIAICGDSAGGNIVINSLLPKRSLRWGSSLYRSLGWDVRRVGWPVECTRLLRYNSLSGTLDIDDSRHRRPRGAVPE